MFDSSPREMMEIAEERYGKRWAGALYHLGVVAFACTAVGIIVAFAIAANEYVVGPAVSNLPNMDVGEYGDLLLSISMTVLLLISSGALVLWRFKKWEEVLFRGIENYAGPRFRNLNERLESVEKVAGELRSEVGDLQIHTGTHPIVKLLTERQMALIVHAARYGVNKSANGSVDVKDKVESYIKNNRIDVLVSNETLGCHPFVNQYKTLFVTYSIGPSGERHEIEVPESHPLVIPGSGVMP